MIVTSFEILSRHLPGAIEKKYESSIKKADLWAEMLTRDLTDMKQDATHSTAMFIMKTGQKLPIA
jgi:hypothetical protein